jgi:hypothetical protein
MQTIIQRTEELVREAAAHTRLALGDAAHAVARRAREERGQISAEFMGLLFIVALVIGAIVALNIHTLISDAIKEFVEDIKSGDTPEGAPEG